MSPADHTFEPPGTVQTRADGLRVNDRIFVRHDDEDLWALITAIKPADAPDALQLELRLDVDGAPVGTCTHTPPLDRRYLRMLPYRRPTDVIPATTAHGLAAAGVLYRSEWDSNGAVRVHLPMRIARQILGDRGWRNVRNPDGEDRGWEAPDGSRHFYTYEAVRFALTAECLDSPPPSALIAA